MKLTVIIPCYNEEKGIRDTILTLLPTTQKHNWQIIVINDGSTDKTLEIINEISGIEVINHIQNKGYGASLKTGINASNTEYISFYDADGQHRPEDLEKLAKKAEYSDMIVGARDKSSHKDWSRKPGKWVLGKFANFISGQKIPDLNSGLRVIRKSEIANYLHLFPEGFSFSTTSTIAFMNLGKKVEYLPIQTKKRVGKSTVKQLKHGSSTLLLILRLMVLFNPLRVFLPTSFFLLFTGIFYQLGFGIYTYINEGKIEIFQGSILFIITGIIIFFFGLMTDQISEIRKHQFQKA